MNDVRRKPTIGSTQPYSPLTAGEGDPYALPPLFDHNVNLSTSGDQQTLVGTPESSDLSLPGHVPLRRGGCCKQFPRTICVPLLLIQLFLLLPSAVLLLLTAYYKVDPSKNVFERSEVPKDAIFVDISATILTNISSVSSTLAPFLIAMVMQMWSLYVARALLESSHEHPANSQPLPTPVQFSILANMQAGRCDQVWEYLKTCRWDPQPRPLVLRRTVIILFSCLLASFFTFLGDQVFHVWSKSINIHHYSLPGTCSSFGRELTPACISLDRSDNYGYPCTLNRSSPVLDPNFVARENEVSYLSANTSRLNQIRFETDGDLPRGDLAVLYPAPGTIPNGVDYNATTLGVSTQCQFLTQICKTKHLSDLLTQFNCTETFFGVLGKPANISYDMQTKAQDPDVPGLAWKISPTLEYMFYSDSDLQVPYNVRGYNTTTGNGYATFPPWPDSKLVNPVFLAIAGRISMFDVASNSTLADQTNDHIFIPTYYGGILDFFLNCSYTTYDVEYTMVNGTTLPNLTFAPSPNGSVAEEWHGRQGYVSFNGDPSGGLAQSAGVAAKQNTPEDFARTWANLYSAKILAVIGAYTDPRQNIAEQVRHGLLVTRIVPWTLYSLLLSNLAYALLALVVGVVACKASSGEVLKVAEGMDLNKQIAEKYGVGTEMSAHTVNGKKASVEQETTEAMGDSQVRVGVIEGRKFGTIYYAI